MLTHKDDETEGAIADCRKDQTSFLIVCEIMHYIISVSLNRSHGYHFTQYHLTHVRVIRD